VQRAEPRSSAASGGGTGGTWDGSCKSIYGYQQLIAHQQRLGVAGVLAALADVIAILVVEAGTAAPFALLRRLGIIAALIVAMVVSVARGADDCKCDEADGDAGENSAPMARLGLLNRSRNEAYRQDGDQA